MSLSTSPKFMNGSLVLLDPDNRMVQLTVPLRGDADRPTQMLHPQIIEGGAP
jgi:hypothetical protein